MSDQLPEWIRESTEPSNVEVQRLLTQLRQHTTRPTGRRSRWVVVPVAALALGVLMLLRPAAYGPAPDAGVALTFHDQAVFLGPSIALEGEGRGEIIHAGVEGTVVRLTEGTVLAEVDPEGRHRALTVLAPGEVAVSVVGTRFSVTWSEDAGGDVSVERGRVMVKSPSGARSLGAGESWRWPPVADTEEQASSEPTHDREDARNVVKTPTRPPEPRHRVERHVPPSKSPAALATPPPRTPARHTPEPEVIAALPSGAVNPPPTPDELGNDNDLSRARALGRVQTAVEDGDYTDAVDLARRFQLQWPGGALGSEAQVLEIEALSHTSPTKAVALAAEWLRIHEQNTRRLEVLRIHASLANDRLGDCALAMPSYEELTRLESGVAQARALGFYSLCAQQTGHESALRSIDSALSHPDLPRSLAPRLRSARKRLPPETLR